MYKIFAELSFFGETLEPEDFTQHFGMAPTYQYRKGDPKGRRGVAKYQEGNWRVCTEENSEPLESHIEKLKIIFADHVNWIHALSMNKNYAVELSCVIHHEEDDFPDISLSKEAVEWICSIGAYIDFDIYHFT